MKRRGSAMVFVVVMFAVMSIVLLATVHVTYGSARLTRRVEDQTRMDYALRGAAEQAAADYTSGVITALPVNRNTVIGGVSCAVTITDNSSVTPRTMLVSAEMTLRNRTERGSVVVPMRRTPSPFFYALFVNNGMTYAGTLSTGSGGDNGDMYVRGNLLLTSLSATINGDLESTGTLSLGTATVLGVYSAGATEIPFPAVNATTYAAAADVNFSKNSISGYTFPSTANEYYLVYKGGNLSVSGTLTGRGTIFVNGDLTITSNITYGSSESRVALIATGKLIFSMNAASPRINQGYYYGASVDIPAAGLTINSGALVVGQLNTLTSPLTIVNDSAVWNSDAEGRKLRLPGLWP